MLVHRCDVFPVECKAETIGEVNLHGNVFRRASLVVQSLDHQRQVPETLWLSCSQQRRTSIVAAVIILRCRQYTDLVWGKARSTDNCTVVAGFDEHDGGRGSRINYLLRVARWEDISSLPCLSSLIG